MSPASRSKSKEKKAAKEQLKASPKLSATSNSGNNVPSTAYDPLSGTFQALETIPASAGPVVQANGRFRSIDEVEDPFSVSIGTSADYDSSSNNGSWSGESEDHKEKNASTTARQDVVPGADSEKREKIRQKNERKHQRQKERRAQELHERCCVYIMSRKLEARVQQLVSMGFSHERSTAALMLNEGKLEQSISWLFEASEDADKYKDQNLGGGTLKIDIADELTRIAAMEVEFKCTKQEVERTVVSSEGDLEKAAESLKTLKLDPPTPLKLEEANDPSPLNSVKSSPSLNLGRDEKDFYPKPPSSDLGSKTMQPSKRVPPKLDWAKPQQVPNSSVSLPAKNLPSPVREPVIMMQRPHVKHISNPSVSSSPPGGIMSHLSSSINPIHGANTKHMIQQLQYQQPKLSVPGTNRGNSLWSRVSASPTLASPSSLGLFSGTSSSTSVDWSSTGTMPQFDYTNIDWSLDRGLTSSSANGFWVGSGSVNGSQMYGSGVSGKLGMRSTVNSHGVAVSGIQDGSDSASSASREWTSPFEGKDLFSLPRQFVSSPSL